MRVIANMYRVAVAIGAIVFLIMIFKGIAQLQNYRSSDDMEGLAIIAFGVMSILLLGPSAILLAIMDDVRTIREMRSSKEQEEA